MQYTHEYRSPLGTLLLAADDEGLTGLWFYGQKHFAHGIQPEHRERELPVFDRTKEWLDRYFVGAHPCMNVPLHLIGTPFQLAVWQQLLAIPYGQTTTYGALASALWGSPAAARAVGSAVGRNPISLLVPCHRVLGAGGMLTGYAGGVSRKAALLQLERGEAQLPQEMQIYSSSRKSMQVQQKYRIPRNTP